MIPDEVVEKLPAPLPLNPMMVRQPEPPTFTFAVYTATPTAVEFDAARPSITMFPPVVFIFTPEPLMQTPSNVPA